MPLWSTTGSIAVALVSFDTYLNSISALLQSFRFYMVLRRCCKYEFVFVCKYSICKLLCGCKLVYVK